MENITQLFTYKYYKKQFKGWHKQSYILLGIGLLFLFLIGFKDGLNMLSFTSTIAGMLGFTCTLAITEGKPINGILGFVSALLLCYVAMVTGNYSDILMQLAYILLLDIPIILGKWKVFSPRKLQTKHKFQTLLFFVVTFALLYGLDTIVLSSPRPFIDALSATIGFTGAFLCVRQFSAQYYFWFTQGVMSIILWLVTAIDGHAVWVLFFTYTLYLANNIIAFTVSNWFNHDKK